MVTPSPHCARSSPSPHMIPSSALVGQGREGGIWGWGPVARHGRAAEGTQRRGLPWPLMSNRRSLEPRFHSAPCPRPAPTPQIRLVFVLRTQCEKMSPRGRAPWPQPRQPELLITRPSSFPASPSSSWLSWGRARKGVRGNYHLLGWRLLAA